MNYVLLEGDPEPTLLAADPEPPVLILIPEPPLRAGNPEPPLLAGDPEPPLLAGNPEPPLNAGDPEPPLLAGDPEPPLPDNDFVEPTLPDLTHLGLSAAAGRRVVASMITMARRQYLQDRVRFATAEADSAWQEVERLILLRKKRRSLQEQSKQSAKRVKFKERRRQRLRKKPYGRRPDLNHLPHGTCL